MKKFGIPQMTLIHLINQDVICASCGDRMCDKYYCDECVDCEGAYDCEAFMCPTHSWKY